MTWCAVSGSPKLRVLEEDVATERESILPLRTLWNISELFTTFVSAVTCVTFIVRKHGCKVSFKKKSQPVVH